MEKKEIRYTGQKAAIFIPALNIEVKAGEIISVGADAADNMIKQGSFEPITKKEVKREIKKKE